MPGLGPLNLADADLKGFDPLDAGRYNAEVFKIEMDAVKNTSGEGKMPAGTPLMKVQYKILNPRINGEDIEQDRRAFQSFVIPPEGYDAKKAAMMKGMLARFFIACGTDEKKVTSAKFDPDFDDYIGCRVQVTLNKREYPPNSGVFNNNVTGVKAPSDDAGASGGLL